MSSDTNLPETISNDTKSLEKEKYELLSKLDLLRSMGYEVGAYTSDTRIEELELVYQIALKNEEDMQENHVFNLLMHISEYVDPYVCTIRIFGWINESKERREERAKKVFANDKLAACINKTWGEMVIDPTCKKTLTFDDYTKIFKSHGIGS